MANFLDSIRNTGNAAAQKAQELAEQTKLNGELGKLRDQRQAMFTELGQMFYNSRKNEGDDPDFSRLIAAIDDVNANTKAIEDRIAILKGGVVCPKCGTIVPQGNRFCSSCGGEMPVPQPQQATVHVQAVCANCNSPLAPGAKFCAKCGTPVSAQAAVPQPETVIDMPEQPQEAVAEEVPAEDAPAEEMPAADAPEEKNDWE